MTVELKQRIGANKMRELLNFYHKLSKENFSYAIASVIIFTIFLFYSEPLLKFLNIIEILKYIRIIAFIFTIFLLIPILKGILDYLYKALLNYIVLKRYKNNLKNLTGEEKTILKYYFKNETKTQKLDVNSGVVTELLKRRILYHGQKYTHARFDNKVVIDCNLQPSAWDILKKHQEYLIIRN
jgi:hypothetical protein